MQAGFVSAKTPVLIPKINGITQKNECISSRTSIEPSSIKYHQAAKFSMNPKSYLTNPTKSDPRDKV